MMVVSQPAVANRTYAPVGISPCGSRRCREEQGSIRGSDTKGSCSSWPVLSTSCIILSLRARVCVG